MEGRHEKRGLNSRSSVVLFWWHTEKQGDEAMCDCTKYALVIQNSQYPCMTERTRAWARATAIGRRKS